MHHNFYKIQPYNFKYVVSFLVCATFVSSTFQDLPMVIGGLYYELGFGFHQKYLNNPFIYLYFLKVFKYIFLLILVGVFINVGDIKKKYGYLFLLILMPQILVDIYQENYLLVVLGLKALIPIIAYFVGRNLKSKDILRLIDFMKISLWVNFIIALYQQLSTIKFLMNQESKLSEYIGIRSGGAFLEPNTFGLYALIYIITIIIAYRRNIISISYTYIFLSLIMIIFSGSRTAMISTLLVIIIFMFTNDIFKKNKIIIQYSVVFLMLVFFMLSIYGRGIDSVLIRISDFYLIFKEASLFELFFGKGFGYGTISSGTYSHIDNSFNISAINTDSQIISFFMQGGGYFLISITILYIVYYLRSNYESRIILVVMLVLGLSVQFIEAWPFGYLAFMLLGFCNRPIKFD